MFPSFISAFSSSPGLFSVLAILFLFELSLIVAAMIRQGRKRLFASIASVVVAVLYAVSMMVAEVYHSGIASWKPKFAAALIGDSGIVSFYHAQFLSAMGFFMLLGAAMMVVIAVLGMLTLRFSFARRVMASLVDVPRQALLFAMLFIALLAIFPIALPLTDQALLQNLIEVSSFVFVLQLFLRLIMGARFERPTDVLAFSFQTGLLMIFLRGLSATIWHDFPFFTPPAEAHFFQELFSFFLGILLSGIIGAFLARNHFSHLFFSPHKKHHRLFSPGFVASLLLCPDVEAPLEFRLTIGILLTFFFAAMLLLASLLSSLLILLPLFFIAYFFLFAILDHYTLSV